ncbi:T9SS type A sorting domain-containing protein [Dyadobacter sandarakinus]|uniref:T9SS type A sorting domain-containing protein n=1 Tax=Dyadobacter sandarakinus TaxID=2747268 RepID=A0ABX7I5P4_9BACT|nr:T9SS type A sorting domain-containing protein [Dyadobacter sandarakinus]QRR01421.1 T9SS type A sorting domain-containing protein [Dyadobacter sandarakinus]
MKRIFTTICITLITMVAVSAQTFEFNTKFAANENGGAIVSEVYTENQNELRITAEEYGKDACDYAWFYNSEGSLVLTGCGASNASDITKILTLEKVDRSTFSPVSINFRPIAYRPYPTSPYELTNLEVQGFRNGAQVGIVYYNNLPAEQDVNLVFNADFVNIDQVKFKVYHQDLMVNQFVMSASLPVTLVSFQAEPTDAGTLLTWNTVDEFQASNFEVQGSGDGKSFQTVGSVQAGSTHGAYEFLYSNGPLKKYFRLKMNDEDGSYAYSKIVAVGFVEKGPKVQFVAFPNPVKGSLRIHVPDKGLPETSVAILDIHGKSILVQNRLVLRAGEGTIECPSHLAPGSYIIKVGNYQAQRISIQ